MIKEYGLKQIKDEIPLPHLQENLEKFVTEHNKNKKDTKKKLVKKNRFGGKIYMKDEYYGKVITHEQFSKSYSQDVNVNDRNVLNSVQVPIGKSFLDDDEFWSLPPDVLLTDDGDYAVYENGELVVIKEGYKEGHQRTLILK